jgi:hypothetical protein
MAAQTVIICLQKPRRDNMSNPTTEDKKFATKFTSFSEFYPFYLSEHSNQTSRRLHFVGTSIGFVLIVAAILTRQPLLILYGVLQGYAFAWVGHYFFEHNRPATFKYPFYSFVGDWRMWADILTGKIKF